MSAVTDLRFESGRFVGLVMRRTKNAPSEFEVENNAHRKARSEPQKVRSSSAKSANHDRHSAQQNNWQRPHCRILMANSSRKTQMPIVPRLKQKLTSNVAQEPNKYHCGWTILGMSRGNAEEYIFTVSKFFIKLLDNSINK